MFYLLISSKLLLSFKLHLFENKTITHFFYKTGNCWLFREGSDTQKRCYTSKGIKKQVREYRATNMYMAFIIFNCQISQILLLRLSTQALYDIFV